MMENINALLKQFKANTIFYYFQILYLMQVGFGTNFTSARVSSSIFDKGPIFPEYEKGEMKKENKKSEIPTTKTQISNKNTNTKKILN